MRLVRIMKKHGMPLVVLLVGIAVGIFLAGHWVPSVSAVSRQDYESLEAFTNILSIVKKNYVEEVDTKNLVNGAINGMLNGLDPHSAYLTPDLYKELQMDTQGRFGGLGIEITVKGGMLTVVSPIEDTPAAKAGIKPGDQIFKIEEEFTKDMTLVDAVKKFLDRVHQRHVFGKLFFDLENLVAGLDAGFGRGRIFDRGNHRQHPALDRDFNSQTAKAPLRIHLQLFVKVGREIGAMGVEAVKHAVDRAVHQVLSVHFFHVVFLDNGENVGEGLEAFVVLPGHRRYARHPVTREKYADGDAHEQNNQRHSMFFHDSYESH